MQVNALMQGKINEYRLHMLVDKVVAPQTLASKRLTFAFFMIFMLCVTFTIRVTR